MHPATFSSGHLLVARAWTRQCRSFSQQPLRRWEEVSSNQRPSRAQPSASKRLQLNGRSYLVPTLTVCNVVGRDAAAPLQPLFHARANKRRTPIVMDLHQVSSDGSPHSQSIKRHELKHQIVQLQEAGYVPVGITNASDDVKQTAAALDLPYFISTRLHQEQLGEDAVADTEEAVMQDEVAASRPAQETAERLPPMVVTRLVRSGQQIYAQNRSLVVLGNVSSGAEVMADEDVVILGALKGRALAGIGGNVRATIVCQSFDAELVSIAHCFTTCDDLEQDDAAPLQLHKPTVISLRNDRLVFESSAV
uniref:Septum formation inhibitor MinC C-terminal domain-containing protein n=1 Tax=Peronospora matthiolae TaxID=2874970 RepID=A0AAV1TVQ8_9STRA